MGKRILRAILIAGIGVSSGNLVYLAQGYQAMSMLADAREVVVAPNADNDRIVKRMEQRCGSYSKLYAACLDTQNSIAGTISTVAGANIKFIIIEAIVSGIILLLTAAALVSLNRKPGKSESCDS